MSDQTPQGPDLDPASEESVRRLLAEARHTGPMPPEVAARLDDLLGKLVDARAAETGVSSLAARRSRRLGLLLVAAAAAVVLGIGVPAINRAGDDTTGSASDSAGSSSADRSGSGSELAQAPAPAGALPTLTLTSDGLEAEVRRALAPLAPDGSANGSQLSLLPASCSPPAGVTYPLLFPATYDGREAFLGAQVASGGEQRADLYLCGEPDPVRSVTVEVP